MIRTIVMLTFWALAAPVAGLIGFSWTLLTGDVSVLYRMFKCGAWTGVRLAGVRVETVGLDRLDPSRTYIFMTNHVSNLDPPIQIPLIPRRTSVMVKQELFDSDSRPRHAHGVAGSGGPRQSRCRHRSGARGEGSGAEA